MVPGRFDLKMKGRHVVHELVRVSAGFGAVPDCALEEAPNGPDGLEEDRHAEVVE